jgi:phosphoribosyl 1,2-cyclic phosphate phosphodiesterase
MKATVTILGSGCSAGTPRIGGDWGNCDPTNPKNYRTRPSIAVRSETTSIIVDTGPDFREQATRENIMNLDAVLYTHSHSDHVNGMDDIRSYYFRRGKNPVPLYMDQETYEEIIVRFEYIFYSKYPIYPPTGAAKIWNNSDFNARHNIGDIEFDLFHQDHGNIKSCGFRFGNVGYSTDMIGFSDHGGVDSLRDVPVWIVDGANWNFNEVICHPNIDRLKYLQDLIRPQKMYLTHLKNDADYEILKSILPYGMEPAYDGLSFEC